MNTLPKSSCRRIFEATGWVDVDYWYIGNDIEPYGQVDFEDEDILNAIKRGVVVPIYSLELLLKKMQTVAAPGTLGNFYLHYSRDDDKSYYWLAGFHNENTPAFRAHSATVAVSKLTLHLVKQKLL